MKPTVEVLISCMHQKDTSIIERTNIQSDVVVVNQCDVDKIEEFDFINKRGETCHAKFISTRERGLSRSRNMAIRNASGDICLICDDDEILKDDYPQLILDTYNSNIKCDFITFNIAIAERQFPNKKLKVGYIRALKTASWQITFIRNTIIRQGINFDVEMGAGITLGGSEENRFLFDCLNVGLKGIYTPTVIGTVHTVNSTWAVTKDNFPRYFKDRGCAYRKLMGPFIGSLYILYSSFRKYSQYTNYCSFLTSIKLQFDGMLKKPKI